MSDPGLHYEGRDWGSFPGRPAFALLMAIVAAVEIARNPGSVKPVFGVPPLLYCLLWIVALSAGLLYWWKRSAR